VAIVRNHRALKRTGGDDNMPCFDLAICGFERIISAVFVAAEAGDFNAGFK